MRYFISGSTGFIGMALAKSLLANDCKVNLLVRSAQKANELLLLGASIFEGDITNKASVEAAMQGCTHVFHLAGYAKPTSIDPGVYHEVNVEGTKNVLDAALSCGVQRVVFTSTAGTFGPTSANIDANEDSPRPQKYHTLYAETKRKAELLCEDYKRRGLDIITVFPTRVFGPGIMNESNSLTKIAALYNKGKWRIIPGNGKTFGNYVFVDDVVNGLMLAMEKSRPGECYILGGENVTFDELFKTMARSSAIKRLLFRLPFALLWLGAAMLSVFGFLLQKPPLITPAWVKRYLQHRRLSSLKAEKELGYTITPLNLAFKKTFAWLNKTEWYFEGNKTISCTLITGASSGIGEAFSRECAKRGQNLLLVSMPKTGLPALAYEIKQTYGVACRFFETDLCQENSYKIVFEYAKINNLKISALINNVGVGYNGSFGSMGDYKLRNMICLNVLTTTLFTQEYLALLQNEKKPFILNVGSLGSFAPTPGKSIYSATKAYVLFFTKSLRVELKTTNITVAAVFPAGVPTNQKIISRIEKQGRLAKSLTTTAAMVAHKGLEGVINGQEIIFPSKRLKSFFFSARILPYGILLKLLEREFRRSPDE